LNDGQPPRDVTDLRRQGQHQTAPVFLRDPIPTGGPTRLREQCLRAGGVMGIAHDVTGMRPQKRRQILIGRCRRAEGQVPNQFGAVQPVCDRLPHTDVVERWVPSVDFDALVLVAILKHQAHVGDLLELVVLVR